MYLPTPNPGKKKRRKKKKIGKKKHIDITVKENAKCKNFLSKIIQEIQDRM